MSRAWIIATLAWLAACGPSTLPEYEAARKAALAPPPPVAKDWKPDAVLLLSAPMIERMLTATLPVYGKIDDPFTLESGIAVEPKLDITGASVTASRTCEACLAVDVTVQGTVATAGVVRLEVPVDMTVGVDLAVEGKTVKSAHIVTVTPKDVRKVALNSARLPSTLRAALEEPLTAAIRTRLIDGAKPVEAARFPAEGLPMAAVRAMGSRNGVRVELLTAAHSPTPLTARVDKIRDGWVFAVQQGNQAPSLHGLRRIDARQRQQRRRDVGTQDDLVHAPALVFFRQTEVRHNQRQPDGLLVHVPLASQAMLAKVEPVVRREDDHRVVQQTALLERGDQSPENVVHTGDQAVVILHRFLVQLRVGKSNLPANAGFRCLQELRQTGKVFFRGGGWLGNGDSGEQFAVPRIGLKRPGVAVLAMCRLGVELQQERLLRRAALHKLHSLVTQFVRLVSPGFARFPLGKISPLSGVTLEDVVLFPRQRTTQPPLADHGRLVAVLLQLSRKRSGKLRPGQRLAEALNSMPPFVLAGEKRGPADGTDGCRTEHVAEQRAPFRQRVQVRRPDEPVAHAAQCVKPLVIRQNEYQVGPICFGGVRLHQRCSSGRPGRQQASDHDCQRESHPLHRAPQPLHDITPLVQEESPEPGTGSTPRTAGSRLCRAVLEVFRLR